MKVLPTTRFGICSGFAPGEPTPAGTPRAEDLQVGPDGRLMPKPLTTWLADELDAMAGKTSGEPLTLQDLADAGVNLKMFTTNLTDGTPYTIPFRNRMFFFSPDKFRELFLPGSSTGWCPMAWFRRPGTRTRSVRRSKRCEVRATGPFPTRRTCPSS